MTVSILPESAPFSDEQRAWLNGFFAGMLGMEDGPGADSYVATEAPQEEEDFPWHDSALPIVDRMELADGKPIERQMMAAMAQLDCGACGYVCQTYSEAIASGEEANLTLCVPGGRETSKMLKKLVKETSGDGSPPAPVNGKLASLVKEDAGWSRSNPYEAKLIESRALNGKGSAKDTRHVAIDLGDSGIEYEVGDALGICPTNCESLVQEIIEHVGESSQTQVDSRGTVKSLQSALMEDCCLKEVTEELLESLASVASDQDELAQLGQLLEDDDDIADCDVLDVLQMFPSAKIAAADLLSSLGSMNPRLYSIASSLKAHDRQVHLTVGKVTWNKNERQRKGVASTMLAERVSPGEPVRVFIQKSHGFTVPANPDAPMIMIGPGTGIAPFLAFLQERKATGAGGRNWLFFGDQHRETDFIYEQELMAYLETGLLDRIDTAFSRDSDQKVYVQNRMQENAADIWQWLEQGGYFFVCGDASRMAVDVDKALHSIIETTGNMSADEAKSYVKAMASQGRYSRDVY